MAGCTQHNCSLLVYCQREGVERYIYISPFKKVFELHRHVYVFKKCISRLEKLFCILCACYNMERDVRGGGGP